MGRTSNTLSSDLRQQLEHFANAAEAAQLAQVLIDASSEGQPVVYANEIFLDLFGQSTDTILGRSLADVVGCMGDGSIARELGPALLTGVVTTCEMQCCRADGSSFPARLVARPVHDDAGKSSYNLLSIVDLDGQSDQRLGGEYRTIYENAPGFIATSHGPDHRFSFANASYRAFVGRECLLGLTVAEAMPELVDQGIIAILDEVYRSGQAFRGTDMPLRIGGPGDLAELRYIDVVYQPMRNTGGEVNGLFCEGYDVTERHAASAEIAALQSQMTHLSRVNAMCTMAATLAHELNQPLCAIANYLESLRLPSGELPEPHRVLQALDGIDQASQRAAGIIRHLRDLTKRREPKRTTFLLQAAVDECIRTVVASSETRGKFVNRIPPATLLSADRVKIQQVIINLLMNASDAVQDTQRQVISISAWEEGNCVVVAVADTGPGVAQEMAQTIFSWSETSKIDGMGLGLAICRTIVELHRGKIWLEKSDADGSEFRFSLPQDA